MRTTNLVHRIKSSTASAAFALLATLLASVQAGRAQSAVVFSQANGFVGVCSTVNMASCDYAGTVSQLAANSRGDIFANVSENGSTYILELPSKGGQELQLLYGTGNAYGAHSVYVDSSNNIYVPDAGDADVIYIPFVNGTYPTGANAGSLAKCSAFPVPATQTTTCVVPLNYPSSVGYYFSAGALGMDGSGNLYLMSKYAGNGYSNVNVLVKVSAATGNFTILANNISNDSGGQIAVNKAGDVVVVTYGSVQEFPAANYSTPIPAYSLNNPDGVQMDANGNLFITNEGAGDILEYPYVNGSYSLPGGNPFIVSNQLSTYSTGKASQGISIDGAGHIAFAGDYPNSISTLTVGSLSFGNTPLNTASGTQTLNLVFNQTVHFASFSVTGPFTVASNTCTVGSNATGANCIVTIAYSASAVGTQLGQIAALDSSGNVLGTAVLSGNGVAATVTADPGTNIADGSGYTSPGAVAVDHYGNIFVADSSTGAIYKTSTGSTAAATQVVTGLTAPSALAVDGAEDLYVAESGKVVELPYNAAAKTYGAPSTLVTGLSGTSGLALDTLGTLYVADSGNARVLRLASSGGLPLGSLVTTVGSGFTTPVAVAIDSASNNMYIADSGTGSVVQFNTKTSSQSAVLTGFSALSSIAVDPSGTLFALDKGKTTVTRLPFINGGLNPNFQTTLNPIVKLPSAIATDSAGNLYVTDTTDGIVETDNRASGLLSFGNITVGQSSSVVAGQISNSGNASFTLGTPDFTQSGATASFAIQSSSTCAAGEALGGGQSCNLAAIFQPQTYGTLTDTLTLGTTAPNTARLALTGIGTPVLINTTLKLAVTSTGTPTYGQPITITATLVPASAAAASPTGNVTFYVDNVAQQPPVTLNSAGTTASINLPKLSGGTHSITASYSGDYFYSSTSSSILTVSLAPSSTITTMTVTAPYINPTSANPATASNSQDVYLTATIVPPVSGTPTGTVTFYNGKTALGIANVIPYTPKGGPTEGQATLDVNSATAPLALGQYSITASYSGDSNYTASSSTATVPLLISNPTVLFTTSATTIIGGGPAIAVLVSSVAGFASTADLSCSGLPQYAACSFSPAYAAVAPSLPATLSFQVVIDQPPVIAVPGSLAAIPGTGASKLAIALGALLFLPSLLFGWNRVAKPSRTRGLRLSLLFAILALTGAVAATLSGCSTSTATYTTPAGTTTITLNAITTAAGAGGSNPIPDPNPTPAATLKLQLTVPQ